MFLALFVRNASKNKNTLEIMPNALEGKKKKSNFYFSLSEAGLLPLFLLISFYAFLCYWEMTRILLST